MASQLKADARFKYVADNAWLYHPFHFFGKGYLLTDAKRREISRIFAVSWIAYWIGFVVCMGYLPSMIKTSYDLVGFQVPVWIVWALAIVCISRFIVWKKLQPMPVYDKGLSYWQGLAEIAQQSPAWRLGFMLAIISLVPLIGVLGMIGFLKGISPIGIGLTFFAAISLGLYFVGMFGYMFYYRIRFRA